VREGVARERPRAERTKHGNVSDPPEREHDAKPRQRGELALEPGEAALLLGRARPVCRRHALHRVHDVHTFESLAVPEPAARQLAVEPLARAVDEERPAGAIGAVKPGREADDREPRAAVAEAGNRPIPVVGMTRAQNGQEPGQARALRAGGNLAFQAFERAVSGRHRARNLRARALALKSLLRPADPDGMRWMGPALVVLALVFSTGGVAVVGHADQGSAAAAAQSQCPAPVVIRRPNAGPTVVRTPVDNKSIVLNTNGYNYPLDGEWHPDPSLTPQGVPAGVLPQDLETPPAASAPK
jgi:hypothetical protein